MKSTSLRQPCSLLFLTVVLLFGVDGQCVDGPLCSYMASQHECELSPEDMLSECPRACKNPCVCSGVSQDKACDCLVKAKTGYCELPSALLDCASTCSPLVTVPCPLLNPPTEPNAHLSTWSTKYLTSVTELCNSGYKPVIARNKGQKTCISQGRWQKHDLYGAPVQCQPVDCGDPPPWPNTNIYYVSTSVGAVAQYSCAQGFVQGPGNWTLTCNASGVWDGGDLLQCHRPADCGPPPPCLQASVTVSGTRAGDIAEYQCLSGYVHVWGNETLICATTGHWEGDLIMCTVLDCGAAPQPPHTLVTTGTTTFNSTANYTCVSAYKHVQGDATLTCGSSGLWIGSPLMCTLVDCASPPTSAHTDVLVLSTTYNSSANYTCHHSYYKIRGDSILICGANGLWIGQVLECAAVNPAAISWKSKVPPLWAIAIGIFAFLTTLIILFIILHITVFKRKKRIHIGQDFVMKSLKSSMVKPGDMDSVFSSCKSGQWKTSTESTHNSTVKPSTVHTNCIRLAVPSPSKVRMNPSNSQMLTVSSTVNRARHCSSHIRLNTISQNARKLLTPAELVQSD